MEKTMTGIQEVFNKWADLYFVGNRVNSFTSLHEAYSSLRTYPTFNLWNIPVFKKHLLIWCEERGYRLNPEESLDKHGCCYDPLKKGEMLVIQL